MDEPVVNLRDSNSTPPRVRRLTDSLRRRLGIPSASAPSIPATPQYTSPTSPTTSIGAIPSRTSALIQHFEQQRARRSQPSSFATPGAAWVSSLTSSFERSQLPSENNVQSSFSLTAGPSNQPTADVSEFETARPQPFQTGQDGSTGTTGSNCASLRGLSPSALDTVELRSGTLWYLNVHDPRSTATPTWTRTEARLFPDKLFLSWSVPEGRATLQLDFVECEEVNSVQSPSHPAATNDPGNIIARNDTYLAENLYPFQLVYSDGIERLGSDSARDRVRWVSAIWETIDRFRYPTIQQRAELNFQSPDPSASQPSAGSASTIFIESVRLSRTNPAVALTSSLIVPAASSIPTPVSTTFRQKGRSLDDDEVVLSPTGETSLRRGRSRRLGTGSPSSSLRRTTSESDLYIGGSVGDPTAYNAPQLLSGSLTESSKDLRSPSHFSTISTNAPAREERDDQQHPLYPPYPPLEPAVIVISPTDSKSTTKMPLYSSQSDVPSSQFHAGSGTSTRSIIPRHTSAPPPVSSEHSSAYGPARALSNISSNDSEPDDFFAHHGEGGSEINLLTTGSRKSDDTARSEDFDDAITLPSITGFDDGRRRYGREDAVASPQLSLLLSNPTSSPQSRTDVPLLPVPLLATKPQDQLSYPPPPPSRPALESSHSDSRALASPLQWKSAKDSADSGWKHSGGLLAGQMARKAHLSTSSPAVSEHYVEKSQSESPSKKGTETRNAMISYSTAPLTPRPRADRLVDGDGGGGGTGSSDSSSSRVSQGGSGSSNVPPSGSGCPSGGRRSDGTPSTQFLTATENSYTTAPPSSSYRTAPLSVLELSSVYETAPLPSTYRTAPTSADSTGSTKFYTAPSTQSDRTSHYSPIRSLSQLKATQYVTASEGYSQYIIPSSAGSLRSREGPRTIPMSSRSITPRILSPSPSNSSNTSSIYSSGLPAAQNGGGIIHSDINSLLRYLQQQDQHRQNTCLRICEQLDRVEQGVLSINQDLQHLTPPPVPQKDFPKAPPSSSPSSHRSSSSVPSDTSSSTARQPPPQSLDVARVMELLQNLLAGEEANRKRQSDIMQFLEEEARRHRRERRDERYKQEGRGISLHRIDDLLRRVLWLLGDSVFAEDDEEEVSEVGPSIRPRYSHPQYEGASIHELENNDDQWTEAESTIRGTSEADSDVRQRAPAPPNSSASGATLKDRLARPLTSTFSESSISARYSSIAPSEPPREVPPGTPIEFHIPLGSRPLPPKPDELPLPQRRSSDESHESFTEGRELPIRSPQPMRPYPPAPRIREEDEETETETASEDDEQLQRDLEDAADQAAADNLRHRRRARREREQQQHHPPPAFPITQGFADRRPDSVRLPRPVYDDEPRRVPVEFFSEGRRRYPRPPLGYEEPMFPRERLAGARDPISQTLYRRGFRPQQPPLPNVFLPDGRMAWPGGVGIPPIYGGRVPYGQMRPGVGLGTPYGLGPGGVGSGPGPWGFGYPAGGEYIRRPYTAGDFPHDVVPPGAAAGLPDELTDQQNEMTRRLHDLTTQLADSRRDHENEVRGLNDAIERLRGDVVNRPPQTLGDVTTRPVAILGDHAPRLTPAATFGDTGVRPAGTVTPVLVEGDTGISRAPIRRPSDVSQTAAERRADDAVREAQRASDTADEALREAGRPGLKSEFRPVAGKIVTEGDAGPSAIRTSTTDITKDSSSRPLQPSLKQENASSLADQAVKEAERATKIADQALLQAGRPPLKSAFQAEGGAPDNPSKPGLLSNVKSAIYGPRPIAKSVEDITKESDVISRSSPPSSTTNEAKVKTTGPSPGPPPKPLLQQDDTEEGFSFRPSAGKSILKPSDGGVATSKIDGRPLEAGHSVKPIGSPGEKLSSKSRDEKKDEGTDGKAASKSKDEVQVGSAPGRSGLVMPFPLAKAETDTGGKHLAPGAKGEKTSSKTPEQLAVGGTGPSGKHAAGLDGLKRVDSKSLAGDAVKDGKISSKTTEQVGGLGESGTITKVGEKTPTPSSSGFVKDFAKIVAADGAKGAVSGKPGDAGKPGVVAAPQDLAKLAETRHKETTDALKDLKKVLGDITNEDKKFRDSDSKSRSDFESWKKTKADQDKKVADGLQKLVDEREAERKVMAQRLADEAKKPSAQSVLDAMAKQNEAQDKLLRGLVTDMATQNATAQKAAFDAMRNSAREQVAFNLAGYMDDFSKTLAAEVKTLMREVGDLREAKRALQHEIADLLLLKARHGGTDGTTLYPLTAGAPGFPGAIPVRPQAAPAAKPAAPAAVKPPEPKKPEQPKPAAPAPQQQFVAPPWGAYPPFGYQPYSYPPPQVAPPTPIPKPAAVAAPYLK